MKLRAGPEADALRGERAKRTGALSALWLRLEVWRDRRRKRRMLMAFSDKQLKDIGISRCDAMGEYSKPFWRL